MPGFMAHLTTCIIEEQRGVSMKLSIMLFVLVKIIKHAVKKYPALKSKAMEKDFSIIIKTEDGARGRYFSFTGGELTSRGNDLAGADITLAWKDADTGFRVMIAQSNKAFVKAIQDGSLKVQGDINMIPQFMAIVKGAMKPSRL
jgi:hypothetical protein